MFIYQAISMCEAFSVCATLSKALEAGQSSEVNELMKFKTTI